MTQIFYLSAEEGKLLVWLVGSMNGTGQRLEFVTWLAGTKVLVACEIVHEFGKGRSQGGSSGLKEGGRYGNLSVGEWEYALGMVWLKWKRKSVWEEKPRSRRESQMRLLRAGKDNESDGDMGEGCDSGGGVPVGRLASSLLRFWQIRWLVSVIPRHLSKSKIGSFPGCFFCD